MAEIGRDALKVGLHVTKGPGADPDSLKAPSSGRAGGPAGEARPDPHGTGRELHGGARCLYTMMATEDFLIDTWPGDPRVAFASACSGHGFKFAPLTGRILAELIVNGQAHLPDGLAAAALFALHRPPDTSSSGLESGLARTYTRVVAFRLTSRPRPDRRLRTPPGRARSFGRPRGAAA